jgi:hypothetical protein
MSIDFTWIKLGDFKSSSALVTRYVTRGRLRLKNKWAGLLFLVALNLTISTGFAG